MEAIERERCAEIWRQYEPYLRKICEVQLRKFPNDTEDVMSELFLALCTKICDDGYPVNPKAWMYGTLSNLINAKFREVYKEKKHTADMTNKEYLLPYGDDFTQDIEDEMFIEQVKEALEDELSDKEKNLMSLIYDEELMLGEIAERWQTTETAVKQQSYRLRRHIKAVAKKFLKNF